MDNGKQRSFGDLGMIRNGNAAVWREFMAQDNMAAGLMVKPIAQTSKSFNEFEQEA